MPIEELLRTKTVERFLKFQISKEDEIQKVVDLAAEICGTPIAMITLIDDEKQHVKFRHGTALQQTDRKDAFCHYTIKHDSVFTVKDALIDNRFVNNPLVTGDPNIRSYAGAPLKTYDGYNLGSLCVIGQEPKELSTIQEKMLQALASQIMHILEFDMSINILKDQFIEVQDSENKLRSFFESSIACNLLLGKSFEIIAFNKAVSDFIEKYFGVKLSREMNIRDFIHVDHLEQFLSNFKRALKGKQTRIETEIHYQDESIWWSISFYPATDKSGDIIGVSYNALDVTSRINQEKRIFRQAESMREISIIQSHQIRKPLSSILGLVNLFKAEAYCSTVEELKLLEIAANELDEKVRLVGNFADKS